MEATGSGSSVRELTATFGHANHLIHPQLATIEQIVTGSSGSRQQRLDAWLATTPSLDGVTAESDALRPALIRCYRFTGCLRKIRMTKIRWRRPFLP
ncbi:C45 family peptidase [Klebsiella variicola subsp. variicola]|nr:C45 family peptidase [Klebsiella variicola subsp. variicola]